MSVSLIDGHIDDDVQMTDEQIIKALEWHSNDEIHCCACPYEEHSVTHYCVDMVIEDALDLINRQKAEIERLKSDIHDCVREVSKSHEIDKNKAIIEFAEELIKRYSTEIEGYYGEIVWVDDIDNLVKEMVGADHGD